MYTRWILATVICCYFSKCTGTFEEDYCWRDYDGLIPSDALIAGLDRNQRPTYIGQILYENKLIPGSIYENENKIHFEFGTARTDNKNIKILCSQHSEKFEWAKTRNTKIIDMTDKHIFVAGYEPNHITYVGRAKTNDEVTVGTVVCHSNGCYELTTVYDGQWYPHYEFEVLTYNSSVKSLLKGAFTTLSNPTTPLSVVFDDILSTTENISEEPVYAITNSDITVELLNSSVTLGINCSVLIFLLSLIIII